MAFFCLIFTFLTMTKHLENLLRDSTLSLLSIAKSSFFTLSSLDNSEIPLNTLFWMTPYLSFSLWSSILFHNIIRRDWWTPSIFDALWSWYLCFPHVSPISMVHPPTESITHPESIYDRCQAGCFKLTLLALSISAHMRTDKGKVRVNVAQSGIGCFLKRFSINEKKKCKKKWRWPRRKMKI